jgi:hypothetical protein
MNTRRCPKILGLRAEPAVPVLKSVCETPERKSTAPLRDSYEDGSVYVLNATIGLTSLFFNVFSNTAGDCLEPLSRLIRSRRASLFSNFPGSTLLRKLLPTRGRSLHRYWLHPTPGIFHPLQWPE